MKKIQFLFTILLASQLLIGQVIHIPNDYSTIQEGIDAADPGETVLVDPGTYVENINFNGKNITVGSLYTTTLDTAYISQTIIDGNANGSVVTFASGEEETASLIGFTITNGNTNSSGGGVHILESSPTLAHLTVKNNIADIGGGIYMGISNSTLNEIVLSNNSGDGGGIACQESSPEMNNLTIVNNTAPHYGGGLYCDGSQLSFFNTTFENNSANNFGGGIFCWDTSNISLENVIIRYNNAEQGGGMSIFDSNPMFKDVTVAHNTATKMGGGLSCSNSIPVFDAEGLCNIYLNSASEGNDIFSDQPLVVNVDTFSVLTPTDFYASPLSNFTFNISNAKKILTAADLYVSPTGDDGNSGTSADDPLKTIRYASSLIYADSFQQRNILLMGGVYSPGTTGESFPVNLPDYISLKGDLYDPAVLDADSTAGVLELLFNESNTISELTLQGGATAKGGGIYAELSGGLNLELSKFVLENIVIQNCHTNYGAAIFFDECQVKLKNVLIANNSAGVKGGGLYFANSSGQVINTTFTDNSGGQSGGAIHNYRSKMLIINTIAWNDTPQEIAYFTSGGSGTYQLSVLNSDIQGGESAIENPEENLVSWAESNIDADPVFLNEWNYPYQINNGSPCIDAGTTDTTALYLPALDLGGDARFFGEYVDIGAYEWNLYVGIDEPKLVDQTTLNIFPNPVNNQATLTFNIQEESSVKIELYNNSGILVKTFSIVEMNAGKQKFSIETNSLKPGIYFLRLQVGAEMVMRKLVKL